MGDMTDRQSQALRLVLGSLSSSAARYGRYIEPLLSLSIDFYVRVFVRVHTGPQQVKHTARYATPHSPAYATLTRTIRSKHGIVYCCSYCQTHNPQSFGRVQQRTNPNGRDVELFKFGAGPQGVSAGGCEHCGNGSLVCAVVYGVTGKWGADDVCRSQDRCGWVRCIPQSSVRRSWRAW